MAHRTASRSRTLHCARAIVTTLLLGAALALGGCSGAEAPAVDPNNPRAGWPDEFVIGFFGGEDAEAVLNENNAFQDYLAERLDLPVRAFTGTNYTMVIEAMRAERVDAMEVGAFSYCLAVEQANAQAIAVNVEAAGEDPAYDPDSTPVYFSTIITRKGSGIRTLEDLRDESFTFVDPASTSGHLMPRTLLLKNGIDPDQDMRVRFAGSHPTSVLAVERGTAAAGATYDINLRRMRDEGAAPVCYFEDGRVGIERSQEEIDALYESCPEDHVTIVAMSDPIPNTPFAVRADLPESFKEAVRAALLDVKNQPELVREMRRWYVDPREQFGVETVDEIYNGLRELARMLDLDLEAQAG